MKSIVPTLSLLLVATAAATGQISAPFTPGGVSIDADGVLRGMEAKPDPRLKDLWKNASKHKKDGDLVYISLPRLFEEARRLAEAKQPLPADLRYLRGMVRLQYVFVYPDEKDLVIAGPCEPFDTDVPFRPLGKVSGRPVLQFEDLVVALRSCGPGHGGTSVGCDLKMTAEIATRIRKKTSEVAPKLESIGERKASELIAEAAGNQPVSFFGVPEDSRFAMVCIEADYQFKQLVLGLLASPVDKVKSYHHLATSPEPPHRWVFEARLDHLAASPDGLAFELRGPALKAAGERMFVEGPEAKAITEAARKFTGLCSEHMEELSRHFVAWADLGNLCDLSVLAALIGADEIPARIGWDLGWAMDPASCKVASVATPKSAPTLVNARHFGGMTIFAGGGVLLEASSLVQKRTKDEKGKISTAAARPQGAAWSWRKNGGETMTPSGGR